MRKPIYDYRALMSEINKIVQKLADPEVADIWMMTKKDVAAWARAFARDTDQTFVEAHAMAWCRWEDLYTDPTDWEDDEEVLMLSTLEFKDGVPKKAWPHLNYWTEVGLARARGFTRKEGIKQQDDFLKNEGGWRKFYGVAKRPAVPVTLTLIEGGKAPPTGPYAPRTAQKRITNAPPSLVIVTDTPTPTLLEMMKGEG